MRKNVVVFFLVIVSLSACAGGPEYSDLPRTVPLTQQYAGPYRIQNGDLLDIVFLYTPKHNEKVVVRPDGNIVLDVAGETRAAGLTAEDLAGSIERLSSKRLRDPKVVVTVKNQKIYVGGEVGSSGTVDYRENLTALQAIVERGGFKDTAQSDRIYIIKMIGNEMQISDIGREEMSMSALSPYDVVFVPKTGVAKANLAVDQYVRKMFFGWVPWW